MHAYVRMRISTSTRARAYARVHMPGYSTLRGATNLGGLGGFPQRERERENERERERERERVRDQTSGVTAGPPALFAPPPRRLGPGAVPALPVAPPKRNSGPLPPAAAAAPARKASPALLRLDGAEPARPARSLGASAIHCGTVLLISSRD